VNEGGEPNPRVLRRKERDSRDSPGFLAAQKALARNDNSNCRSDLIVLVVILEKLLGRDVRGRGFFVDGEARLGAQHLVRVLLKALAQFVDFRGQLDDYIGERVADIFGVGDDDAFAVAQDDVSRYPDDRLICRYIAEHN